MKDKKNKILVIAAHPDDEVLGCGGTIAHLVGENHTIYSLILGEGITSRDDQRSVKKRKPELEYLKHQADLANKIIGVEKVFMYNFPDNRFDTVALLDIIKTIEKVIDTIQPDIVFTHSGYDLNKDHRITFQAVLTATRPLPGCHVKTVYSFEVLSASEWSFGNDTQTFSPNYFVDISRTIQKKIDALKVYNSEINPFPHPRSIEAVLSQAKLRGSQCGIHAAEAFKLIRHIEAII